MDVHPIKMVLIGIDPYPTLKISVLLFPPKDFLNLLWQPWHGGIHGITHGFAKPRPRHRKKSATGVAA